MLSPNSHAEPLAELAQAELSSRSSDLVREIGRDKATCFQRHLNEEGSLQSPGQVVVPAEQSELLRRAQLPPQHAGFLQLLKLLPDAEKTTGS